MLGRIRAARAAHQLVRLHRLEAAKMQKRATEIRGQERVESVEALPGVIAAEAKDGDLVVLLGAGDITQWAYALPGQLEGLG